MTAGAGGLRRYLAPRAPTPTPAERCDLCATEVDDEHPHLLDTTGGALRCACRPCALLFADRPREVAGTGYRTVPDRYRSDPDFALSDEQWDALQIPVGLAFFRRGAAGDEAERSSTRTFGAVVACYPGPAGATESELDLARFDEGVGAGRLARLLEPEVEALLVRHESGGASESLLVPIDACYRLVGLVRRYWKGFDGGAEAWAHIEAFFADVRSRARALDELSAPGVPR